MIHHIPSIAPLTGTVFLPPLPLDSAEAVASTVLWRSSPSTVSRREVFIRNHPHHHQHLSLLHLHGTATPTMVGVPGKYRGCETCRGRRVKCGASSPPYPIILSAKRLTPLALPGNERPFCKRCVDSSRPCTYERETVFIVASIEDGGRCKSLSASVHYLQQSVTDPTATAHQAPPTPRERQPRKPSQNHPRYDLR